jgi:hypothetical protein
MKFSLDFTKNRQFTRNKEDVLSVISKTVDIN